ncbi:hypothetical protein AALB53_24895, partial [Lachnospiraceae bacterium 47-T17]
TSCKSGSTGPLSYWNQDFELVSQLPNKIQKYRPQSRLGGTLCKIGSPLLSFLLCSLCTPLQVIVKKNESFFVDGMVPHSIWNNADQTTVVIKISTEREQNV